MAGTYCADYMDGANRRSTRSNNGNVGKLKVTVDAGRSTSSLRSKPRPYVVEEWMFITEQPNVVGRYGCPHGPHAVEL